MLTERQRRSRRARRLLAARGLIEAMTWSFIPRSRPTLFGGGAEALELANPISIEMSSMRPPRCSQACITAVARNRNRGFADVALFELGQAYRGDAPEDQFITAAGVRAGTAKLAGAGRHWSGKADDAGMFDVKADVVAVLAALGFDASQGADHARRAGVVPSRPVGTLRLGPKIVLAHFGELHPATLKALDVDGPVAAFEVFLDALPPEKKKSRTKPALLDLRSAARAARFRVLARPQGAGGRCRQGCRGSRQGADRRRDRVRPVRGRRLAAEGKKSLAIEVTLQPKATLTDKELDAISQKIIADVKKATGGEIRG